MPPASTRRLCQAAVAGIVVYVAVDVALVFLRPGFSVLHNAESDYGSRGPYGWVMNANFVLRGLIGLAVVVALVRVGPRTPRLRAGLWLLGIWAVGSALLAAFPDDPVGTKLQASGRVHLLLAGVAFLAVLAGTFVSGRALGRDPRYARVRLPLLALSVGGLVALLLLGRAGFHAHSLGALWEKVFLGFELAWFAVAAAASAGLAPTGPAAG